MSIPFPNVIETLFALVVVSIFSVLYKDNPIFRFVQALITGVAVANVALTAITVILQYNVNPLVAGNYQYLVSVVWGLLCWTFFIPRLRSVYRLLMACFIATEMAIVVRGRFDYMLTQMMNWSGGLATDPVKILYPIVIICELLYFLYWKKSDDLLGPYLRIPRLIARYSFGIFFAFAIGGTIVATATTATSLLIRMNYFGGLYIAAIALIVIAIDALVGWRKIFGMSTTVTAT